MRVTRALSVRTRADRAFGARFLFVGLLRMRAAVRFGVAAVLAVGGLMIGVLPMTAAHADTGRRTRLADEPDRASDGLAPLADDSSLAAVAKAKRTGWLRLACCTTIHRSARTCAAGPVSAKTSAMAAPCRS